MSSTHHPETRKKLKVVIDDKTLTTHDDDMEASVLLRLVDRDPEIYDLARVKKDGDLHVFRDGKVLDLHDGDRFVSVIFEAEVNDTFVPLHKRKQTGASIKAAAIAASVPIEPDFVLSKILETGEDIVTDDTEITVRYHDKFWAIPGDDNS